MYIYIFHFSLLKFRIFKKEKLELDYFSIFVFLKKN